MKKLWLWTAVAASLIPACGEGSLETATSEEAQTASTMTLACSISALSSWPRSVTASVDALHRTHAPFTWFWTPASSSAGIGPDSSMSFTAETCNVTTSVTDDEAHTSNQCAWNVIDVRDSFAAPPASRTVAIGSSANLDVPAPHATRHCDGLGSFYWEVYNSAAGTWTKVSGSDNLAHLTVSSPTPGDETYRIRCSHPEGLHYSAPITVNWVSNPTCSVSCVQTSYPAFQCTVTASGGVAPYTYFASTNGGAYGAISNPSGWSCRYRIIGYTYTADFKVRDAGGQECAPRRWVCGGIQQAE